MKYNKKNVLILEDDPAHAEAIKRYLSMSENDCNIIIATSLKQFNLIISHVVPDLIIADINLPDGTAFSLLKGDMENQPWPVMVMTSYGDEEIAVKAIKSGALDYIVKSPETFKNIEHVVRRNLREWRNIQRSRESENKFRILFETMAQGVLYHDVNGSITAANSAAEKITGLSLEEMQKNPLFNSDDWVAIQEDESVSPGETFPAYEALRTGLPVRNRVMGIHHPHSDKYIWLLINAIPQFRENAATPYQVFTTFTDITELKMAEFELKKAKEKAEESDRLKSAFMANMSHEIRTPMNGILGFADLLRTPELSGESQKMYIEAINSSGKRMLSIINDLIDISRIESGLIEIRKQKTNISKILNEQLMFFTPEASQKGIRLKLNSQLPPLEFIVETDKTKISQVIANLMKNAVKFTTTGFIELGCRIKDNSNLFFYVEDSGMGIRKDLQEKIFDRFRQGDGADEHEGVGLGLAISKAYVELLGGSIGIESESGKGSVFYFTIPLGHSVAINTPVAGNNSSGSETMKRLSILIVEDDDLSYFYLEESFKKVNIKISRARDGLEAVDMIRNKLKPDLILMDIKLPLMNGIDATREIKKIDRDIPVIAQSAYVNQTDIERSYEAGCDDYISKPVNMKDLLNKIYSFYQI